MDKYQDKHLNYAAHPMCHRPPAVKGTFPKQVHQKELGTWLGYNWHSNRQIFLPFCESLSQKYLLKHL